MFAGAHGAAVDVQLAPSALGLFSVLRSWWFGLAAQPQSC